MYVTGFPFQIYVANSLYETDANRCLHAYSIVDLKMAVVIRRWQTRWLKIWIFKIERGIFSFIQDNSKVCIIVIVGGDLRSSLVILKNSEIPEKINIFVCGRHLLFLIFYWVQVTIEMSHISNIVVWSCNYPEKPRNICLYQA